MKVRIDSRESVSGADGGYEEITSSPGPGSKRLLDVEANGVNDSLSVINLNLQATDLSIQTGNAILQDIEAGIAESLGQKNMAESAPVVIASNQTPPQMTSQIFFLLNGTSKDMNVNGSITPVNFNFTPTSGSYYVEKIIIFIADTGTQSFDNFGAIAGPLTNGLLIKTKSNGAENDFINLKNNTDIAMSFHEHAVLLAAISTGFLNSNDFFMGSISFNNPITLKSSTGDFLRATVRDDLTALTILRILAYVNITT